MIYENLNARNSDTSRGIRHLPSAIVMKKSIQIGEKLHRTLAEPMQEQYTSIEEKCNKCQKSSFIGGHMKEIKRDIYLNRLIRRRENCLILIITVQFQEAFC